MVVTIPPNGLSVMTEPEQRKNNSEVHIYKIRKARSSESSMVFFAYCLETKQHVVIKILRNYKDTRYNLTDPQKRLECQIEALWWNQKITPNIYRGLGCIVEPELKCIEHGAKENALHSITIENITKDIQQLSNIINPKQEYALIMECLPKERRLDYLLRQKNIDVIHEVLKVLVRRIAEIHEVAPYSDDISSKNNERYWGSYDQLKDKLAHNTELFNNLRSLKDQSFYKNYIWLIKDLKKIIEGPAWHQYFRQRLEQGRIKRCHGDLKARNTWVEPATHNNDPAHRVKLLDTIDFNPSYCNIDVLSDIAMLIIDVQAVDIHLHEHDRLRGQGRKLAQFIIDTYCTYSREKKSDATSQLVLTYYLVEKALVRASIGLFYDRNEYPQLGPYFLNIAEEYMTQLRKLSQVSSSPSHDRLVTAR